MIDLSAQLAPLQQWLDKLEKRERQLVIGGGIALLLMLLYGLLWEPIFSAQETQKTRYQSQQQLLVWMQENAAKINALQAGAGGSNASRFKNQSVSSLTERSALSMGVKKQISKLESTKKGVKVNFKQVDFDRLVFWLNDLQQKYNIQASSIKIEPQQAPGAVDARISLQRNN